jgi:hypothetical protein
LRRRHLPLKNTQKVINYSCPAMAYYPIKGYSSRQ